MMVTGPGNQKPAKKGGALAAKYVLTCASATFAETLTYPLDILKTRLQNDSRSVALKTSPSSPQPQRHGSATVHAVRAIVADGNGIRSLWRGVMPAVCRHYVYTGLKMSVYEWLRDTYRSSRGSAAFTIVPSAAAGAFAGAASQFCASPIDLVKVRMQTAARGAPTQSPLSTGGTVRAIWLEGGGSVAYFWRGWQPNVHRAVLLTIADICTYDKVKQYLKTKPVFQYRDEEGTIKETATLHMASSACSGLAAAVSSTPMDVAKTRMMQQIAKGDKNGSAGVGYRSTWHCISSVAKSEGFFALYKGFVPIWSRMAPWSFIFWVSYERIRQITGLKPF